jgi:hypothetical protein
MREVVRGWYRSHKMDVPVRIVIVSRSDEHWILHAGSVLDESGFSIDPVSKKILKYTPGD